MANEFWSTQCGLTQGPMQATGKVDRSIQLVQDPDYIVLMRLEIVGPPEEKARQVWSNVGTFAGLRRSSVTMPQQPTET